MMYKEYGGMPKDLKPEHDYDPKVWELVSSGRKLSLMASFAYRCWTCQTLLSTGCPVPLTLPIMAPLAFRQEIDKMHLRLAVSSPLYLLCVISGLQYEQSSSPRL